MILIRKGMQGVVVGNVQQFLTENGYSVQQTELISSTFGDSTYEAVRSFQASHLGSDGQPLASDGVVGPETLWALQHPSEPSGGDDVYYAQGWYYNPDEVSDKVRPALDAMCGEIGVHEKPDGSNDGPRVRVYTAPDFIGDPWCCLFASWGFSHLPGGSPFGRMASTWGLYEWASQRGLLVSASDDILPGDILLILRGDLNDPKHRGHVMPAIKTLPSGRILTVAGNESNAVRGGIRDRSTISAVVRVL